MKITVPVYISGVSVLIPEQRQPITRAIDEGWLTAGQAAACDADTLPVSGDGQTADEMALTVAQDVLAAAGIPARAIDLLIYSWMADTPTGWKAASHLARVLGSKRAVALSVRQLCNGGAMAVQLAAAHLMSERRADVCMVVTGDALGPDSVRRWQVGITGAPLGDGAAALVLSRAQGDLRVRSIASSARPGHEKVFPEDNPALFGGPVADEEPDASAGMLFNMLRRCVGEAITDACDDAEIKVNDPRLEAILLPRVSRSVINTLVSGVLAPGTGAEIVHAPEKTGHLFSGDMLANVMHLTEERPIDPGSLALIVNIGAGFTATCMIVERRAA
jgi:3-oxoacyl-[acyl-carrier-protein] synthase III